VAPAPKAAGEQTYHHGDLRRALLDEAIAAIAEGGPGAVTLRGLARRVGVSHAAPLHHFHDKAGLLTALAAEGYRLLAEALRDARHSTDGNVEVAVAYVRFAIEHRPHFFVMFRPEPYRADDPELVAARTAAREALFGAMRCATDDDPDHATLTAGVAGWSLVHGLATLYIDDNLPPQLGDDPEQIARSLAAQLSGPGGL
jgi:AcrR family transcriptional regulator